MTEAYTPGPLPIIAAVCRESGLVETINALVDWGLGNSDLYGRFTERLDLRPLNFAAAQEFVPDEYSPEERIFTWGIFGGVPYYLDGVDLGRDLGTVLTEEVLSQRGYLHNEPEYVLRTELTDPNRYFAILTAIAAGKTTSNGIAQAIGINGKQISTYTQKLERLRFIEREVPITEEKAKSRRGAIESWIPCSGSGSASSTARKIDTNDSERMPTTRSLSRNFQTS